MTNFANQKAAMILGLVFVSSAALPNAEAKGVILPTIIKKAVTYSIKNGHATKEEVLGMAIITQTHLARIRKAIQEESSALTLGSNGFVVVQKSTAQPNRPGQIVFKSDALAVAKPPYQIRPMFKEEKADFVAKLKAKKSNLANLIAEAKSLVNKKMGELPDSYAFQKLGDHLNSALEDIKTLTNQGHADQALEAIRSGFETNEAVRAAAQST